MERQIRATDSSKLLSDSSGISRLTGLKLAVLEQE